MFDRYYIIEGVSMEAACVMMQQPKDSAPSRENTPQQIDSQLQPG